MKLHTLTTETALETGQLKLCQPFAETTENWLASARQDLAAATIVLAHDLAGPAYTAAYDCLRKTLTAFLNAQGLRVAGDGGHHAILIETVREQLGAAFGGLGPRMSTMRATRNALEYADRAPVTLQDAREAVETATSVLAGLAHLINSGEVPLHRGAGQLLSA